MNSLRTVVLAMLLILPASAASAGTLTLTYGGSGDGIGFDFNGPISGVLTLELQASSPTMITGSFGILKTLGIQSSGLGTLLATGSRTITVTITGTGSGSVGGFQAFLSGVCCFSFGGFQLNVPDLAGTTFGATISQGILATTGSGSSTFLSQSYVFGGTELSRSFVPEPATPTLMLSGLAGAALLAVVWRNRRR